MKMSFLDYYKLILDKVSFDSHLFAREYQKAKKTLNSREVKSLDNWLQQHGLVNKLQLSSENQYRDLQLNQSS